MVSLSMTLGARADGALSFGDSEGVCSDGLGCQECSTSLLGGFPDSVCCEEVSACSMNRYLGGNQCWSVLTWKPRNPEVAATAVAGSELHSPTRQTCIEQFLVLRDALAFD